MPSPSSTSTKLKSRAPGAADARRTARMFTYARARAGTSSATLLSTITPYAVPTKAARSPTYASVSASPARTMAAMERKASAEKRFIVAGSASPARSEGGLFKMRRGSVTPARPSAIANSTRCARPPIHNAAATWCAASSAMRGARHSTRATAWLTTAEEATSSVAVTVSAVQGSRGAARRASVNASAATAAARTTRAVAVSAKVVSKKAASGQAPWTSATAVRPTSTTAAWASAAPAAAAAIVRSASAVGASGLTWGSARSTNRSHATPPSATLVRTRIRPRRRTSTNPAIPQGASRNW